MLIWIIDEEWTEYELEKETLEKEFPGVEIKYSRYDYEDDLKEFGYKADGILSQIYTEISKETIDKLENCKVIAVYGGGYDRIDIQAAKAKGIMVTNIQDYCSEDLADYTIAAIYFLNKKLHEYFNTINDVVEKGEWGATAALELTHRVENQKLLIYGLGAIGKVVADKAKANGLEVMAYDEYKSDDEISALGVKPVNLEEGLKEADYVSINLKGVDSNKDKVNKEFLKMMKNSAYIINTARGKIINEEDLIEAVNSGEIAGAILDVVKTEPGVKGDPIFNTKNIFVTPHISYISIEAMRNLKEFALGNLISVINGETPRDPVY